MVACTGYNIMRQTIKTNASIWWLVQTLRCLLKTHVSIGDHRVLRK